MARTPVEHPILFSAPMVKAILEGRKTQTRRVVKPQPKLDPAGATFRYQKGSALCSYWVPNDAGIRDISRLCAEQCPYGVPGDRLWVKETFVEYPPLLPTDSHGTVHYHADDEHDGVRPWNGQKWKPSIFMPRWASRITLEIEYVRVQRLQEISEEDAIAEGIEPIVSMGTYRTWKNYAPGLPAHVTAIESYRTLWNSINLKPKPIEERGADGKKHIVGYISFPWSNEDFDVVYPGAREAGLYRGKPLTVVANPWVWALTFKRVAGKERG